MRRLLLLLLLAPGLALVPATAHAQAPDATGWWNAAHRSDLPAPPPPPDVSDGDLLLQGGDVQRDMPDTPPAPTALAALRYAVPEGATVTALTLQLATGAQVSDVRAYATTSAWKPVENGAIDDAPTPDLSRYALATLSADGTSLSFADIGKLTTDSGLLDVILVPGVSDRLVVRHPSATALSVTSSPALGGPPAARVPPPVVPVVPVVAPVAPPILPVPDVPSAPSVAPTSAAPAPQQAAQPVAAAARRKVVGDDGRARLVVGLEAVLVAVFFGLLGHGPLGVLGRLSGNADPAQAERGIGRFRGPRVGTAPRL
jgi:hypothetical protein